MLSLYCFAKPIQWVVPLIIQIISYIKILDKMGKNKFMGIIPAFGEMEMSKDLFRRMRSFWRPMAVFVMMMITAFYLRRNLEYTLILRDVAFIVYGVMLCRLYWKLGKQFGKGGFFRIGLMLFPFIFLPVLAFGKSWYLGKPEYPEDGKHRKSKFFRRLVLVVISLIEAAALVGVCFFVTMQVRPLRPIAESVNHEMRDKVAGLTETEDYLDREDTLGADYQTEIAGLRSRDYFFPDHSNDENVVVMSYIIGSNLEDSIGAASINISEMIEATTKGDALTFVMQTGGSSRWFTRGVADNTVGRYTVKGGKVEKAKGLSSKLCMTEPQNLLDFINWTKENYPADRYMLVLWDHGGGLTYGYGDDFNNPRTNSPTGESGLSISEIVGAIRDSGVKFDMVGFDACLMQNIEIANQLEPYADYYLGSQESEPSTGWYYTAAFSKLAEDPGMPTEELGRIMVTSYDNLNKTVFPDKDNSGFSLSMVDLTLVRSAYKDLAKIFKKVNNNLADDHTIFADFSAARAYSYEFGDGEQVDLSDFISKLKSADTDDTVATDEALDKLDRKVKACITSRSSIAAQGINGLSVTIPYRAFSSYQLTHDQYKSAGYKSEMEAMDKVGSIMLSQTQSALENMGSLPEPLASAITEMTKHDWYVEGFEDYNTTDLYIDIPLLETEGGYVPELDDNTWAIILDSRIAAYQETEDGLRRFIGYDHVDGKTAEGHPVFALDGKWIFVNHRLVCYDAGTPRTTDDGIIYNGTAKARLNGEKDITLYIEWEPVPDESTQPARGHITGYTEDDNPLAFMERGYGELHTGDKVEFLFDYYDAEGNFVKTEPYGRAITVTSQDKLVSRDEPLEVGEYEFFGVLTDIYQRGMETEVLTATIE